MQLPSGLGSEAAGIIEEVGPGVTGLKPGDRVAYAGGPLGAYSEGRVMPADRLIPLPARIHHPQGAAVMVEGITPPEPNRPTHCLEARPTEPIHPPPRAGRRVVCP